MVSRLATARAGITIRLARRKPYALKNSALKMPMILVTPKYINFIVQTALQQADIVAIRLSIAAATSTSLSVRGGPPVSQPVAGRWPLAGHRLIDWTKQKLALEPGCLRPTNT